MKWAGKIGFAETVETEPSVYEEGITERKYYGDVLEWSRRMETGSGVNPDITMQNRLSVLGDPYASTNLYKMRYAEYLGQNWAITGVQVQYPRLILTLGGLWNGREAG